ncbi:MAG: RidA family protein [Bosea sp. (in: a-proteobacteria)]
MRKSILAAASTIGILMTMISANAQNNPSNLRAVNPPGPAIPGISSAVLANEGKMLFLSGHVPFNEKGEIPAGLEAQLRTVFQNLSATLKAADTDFKSVVRVTILVKDYNPSMLSTIRKVRDEFVNASLPPASALIGVASLFHPDVLAEVDAIAVIK